jgi:hypothetical protein
MGQWYVCQVADGQYLGQKWEMVNQSPRRPRDALVSLQDATKYFTLTEARREAIRAVENLGVHAVPVPIRIEGRGRDAQIKLDKVDG